jgi:uncharacterized protein YegL
MSTHFAKRVLQCSACQQTFHSKMMLERHLDQEGHRFLKREGKINTTSATPSRFPHSSRAATPECRYGSGCVKRATCPFAHPTRHPTRAPSLHLQPQHSDSDSLTQLFKDFQGMSIQRHGQNGLSVSKSQHSIQRGKGHVAFKSQKKEVKVAKISVPARGAGRKQRQAVFVSFLIDTSGSMSGSKLKAVKEGLPKILKLLDDDDLVFLQTFDSTIERVTQRPIKPSKLDQALIDGLQTRGCTKLHDAITTTLPNFKKDSKRLPVLVVLTDGQDFRSVGSASDAKSALEKPGVSNFHGVLIGVGKEAKSALSAIDPQKPHTSLHSVEDSAKGIQKAFQWLSQKIQTIQVLQITTIQREVRVLGGGAKGLLPSSKVSGAKGLLPSSKVSAPFGGPGAYQKSWRKGSGAQQKSWRKKG